MPTEEDIDKLLDEFEVLSIKKETVSFSDCRYEGSIPLLMQRNSAPSVNHNKPYIIPKIIVNSKESDSIVPNLDDLLDEFEVSESVKGSSNKNFSIKKKIETLKSEIDEIKIKQKCIPPILGPLLKNTSNLKSPCENLFCLKCDLNVIKFGDKFWCRNESTGADLEYLFFRNNFPDLEKLQVGLVIAASVHGLA
ncbi:hypothetical protein HDU92_002296 [Lobulomyces angularis]|nr:hypothetical protein HDU92_002296 [Lobulomyces angularis]